MSYYIRGLPLDIFDFDTVPSFFSNNSLFISLIPFFLLAAIRAKTIYSIDRWTADAKSVVVCPKLTYLHKMSQFKNEIAKGREREREKQWEWDRDDTVEEERERERLHSTETKYSCFQFTYEDQAVCDYYLSI